MFFSIRECCAYNTVMIVVFGSIYMDLNVKVKNFPEAGESVLTQSYTSTPGGKGANQALAAARTGTKTALVGKVGDDGAGLRILNNLKRHEVMTSGVAKSEEFPTGMAMVMKGKSGKPRTVVALGANALVDAEQAPTDIFRPENVLLVQMELPMEQNALVMKNAKEKGSKVILNLAPSLSIPKPLFSLVDFLIVNQIEARRLGERLGIDVEEGTVKLATKLAKDGNLTCIVTMGPDGVIAVEPNGKGWQLPSMKFDKVVDTTGAGDCFCGTFAACIHEGRPLAVALKMSTVASGLSCLKEGVIESYPYLDDVEEAMEDFAEVKPL